jgi:hypothetical protein
VAIGGGIGGVALAVACFAWGIPFTIYERDNGSKLDLRAMDSLCNKLVKQSKDWVFLIRRRSNFHQTFGSYYRWKSDRMGNEKMDAVRGAKSPKRTTYRKAILRFALLEQLGGHDKISNINWLI